MYFGVLKTWSACRWIKTGSISHKYVIASYISTPGIVFHSRNCQRQHKLFDRLMENQKWAYNESGLTSLLIGWFCRWLAKDPVRYICTAAMKENPTHCYVLYYYSYCYCYRYRYRFCYRFRYPYRYRYYYHRHLLQSDCLHVVRLRRASTNVRIMQSYITREAHSHHEHLRLGYMRYSSWRMNLSHLGLGSMAKFNRFYTGPSKNIYSCSS